jgi:hypothetical protein
MIAWLFVLGCAGLLMFSPLAIAMLTEPLAKTVTHRKSGRHEEPPTDAPQSFNRERSLISRHRAGSSPEPWLLRLKAACDAGYYHSEVDRELQVGFPWQNRSCKD